LRAHDEQPNGAVLKNLFPVGAVFRSAKNHVAMSLGCERDELGNDFILSISEEIDVIQKTEMLLVGLALGKMNPEKLRLKLFTRLAGDKKDAVQEALIVASPREKDPIRLG
jgi:hypothetical protein